MLEMIDTPTTSPSNFKKKRTGLSGFLVILVVLLVAGLAVTGYLYYTTRTELMRLTQPSGQEELAKREVKAVVDKLGKLTILPEEEPVVATIVDSDFLATQSAFYQKAENGDKLVVYPQAQKAYIFSPGRNIIVNAGPLVLDQNEQPPQGTQTEVTEEAAAASPSPRAVASPSPSAESDL